jgi:hypothetical protein
VSSVAQERSPGYVDRALLQCFERQHLEGSLAARTTGAAAHAAYDWSQRPATTAVKVRAVRMTTTGSKGSV